MPPRQGLDLDNRLDLENRDVLWPPIFFIYKHTAVHKTENKPAP